MGLIMMSNGFKKIMESISSTCLILGRLQESWALRASHWLTYYKIIAMCLQIRNISLRIGDSDRSQRRCYAMQGKIHITYCTSMM